MNTYRYFKKTTFCNAENTTGCNLQKGLEGQALAPVLYSLGNPISQKMEERGDRREEVAAADRTDEGWNRLSIHSLFHSTLLSFVVFTA